MPIPPLSCIFEPILNLFRSTKTTTSTMSSCNSNNNNNNKNNNKICIVGAGPSGLALGALLEKQGGCDYVIYESSAEDVPPRGGCLDLHPGSGQRALKDAGVFEEFKKYARYGDATIHRLFSHKGENFFDFGEGRDAPEIDRWALRKVLLSGIPKGKVHWKNRRRWYLVQGAAFGKKSLVDHFPSALESFSYLGIDSARQVTDAKPQYSGNLFVTTKILPGGPYYEKMKELCRMGSMIVMGKGVHMFNSRQGDGHYRVDVGIPGPENFADAGLVDIKDWDAFKKYLLGDDLFGPYSDEMKEIINQSQGPFRPWIMYYFPTDSLNWKTVPGVTLIGDAAHVTTPFVGDGVNCAMRDAIILAGKLKELGVNEEAVAAYEREMFPFAIDVITRSLQSQKMFFEKEAPKTFIEVMSSGKPLIGTTDHI
ncbi:uncharacterized protein PODANS_1_21840 [Podospora anserina S mat+]|uniref:Podospora anserina S mat+ genomic DNA chromosome 1, supercontig 6 n=1 Tax=Podospora anserina (strain S / ATCC MYA-4624 / DSM 980 / FGSC 10383) TaxID=515849 RepID=B2ARZ9_PODAN|nr:uncharacterized protein PODANS_1_21840 [Podospora anserina S mat+]CAP67170.1 unnamed protein product [Podospora anserina S mat+]CDP24583.1 Putative protein of unknown function [Podospora anserina S mat+]